MSEEKNKNLQPQAPEEEKITSFEFCSTVGIRARDREVCKMLYKDRVETQTKWREILQKDGVVDFESVRNFANEERQKTILEFKKTKQ